MSIYQFTVAGAAQSERASKKEGTAMMESRILLLAAAVCCTVAAAKAQSADSCGDLANFKIDGAEITKAAAVQAGTTVPGPFPGAPAIGPLPAHCRVDGVINRRKGVGGEEFGIGFEVALPEKDAWNGDFMMQCGGGGNGVVAYPAGARLPQDREKICKHFVENCK